MENTKKSDIKDILNEINKPIDLRINYKTLSKKIEKDLERLLNFIKNNNNKITQENIFTNLINEGNNQPVDTNENNNNNIIINNDIMPDIDFKDVLVSLKKSISILNKKIEENEKIHEKQLKDIEEYNKMKNDLILMSEQENQCQKLLIKDNIEKLKGYEELIKIKDEKIIKLNDEKNALSEDLIKTMEDFEKQYLEDENEIQKYKNELKKNDDIINQISQDIQSLKNEYENKIKEFDEQSKNKEKTINKLKNKLHKYKNKFNSELKKFFIKMNEDESNEENTCININNDLFSIIQNDNLKSIIYILLIKCGIPFSDINGNFFNHINNLKSKIDENLYKVLNNLYDKYKETNNTNISKDIFKNLSGNSEIIVPDEIIKKTRDILNEYHPKYVDENKIEELVKEINNLNIN
jgi:hypothetical protein